VSPASFIEQSAMLSKNGRSRSRGRGHDFGGRRGPFGGNCGSNDGKQTRGDKKSKQCKHCKRNNHISEKGWEKFGHPEWAQLADADTSVPGDTAHVRTP